MYECLCYNDVERYVRLRDVAIFFLRINFCSSAAAFKVPFDMPVTGSQVKLTSIFRIFALFL